MTVLTIGPATQDKIIKNNNTSLKVGGPTYFQSFVFSKLNINYKTIVNLSNLDLIKQFPNLDHVVPIIKSDTHLFINKYPYSNNLNIRKQYSNFANIPILKKDLEKIFEKIDKIEAIAINPLNQFDFPLKTIKYLKDLNIPLYLSIQGFIRYKKEDFSVGLSFNKNLIKILDNIEALFLDENEAKIVFNEDYSNYNINEIIITRGYKGSKIIKNNNIIEIKAVKNNNILDATGCGDTYMAAYISKKLESQSVKKAGEFASLISSKKLSINGPYN